MEYPEVLIGSAAAREREIDVTLLLTETEVEGLLAVGDLIPVLEEAYRELGEGRGASRTTSEICAPTTHKDSLYILKTMDGVIPRLGVSAIRLCSDIVSWPRDEHGLRNVKLPAAPGNRFTGLVLLFSTETGEPLAIMPDGVIQQMRVGVANALGIKYMAREDARTIGIIGTGSQAAAQVKAACAVRRIERIRCWSPKDESRARFSREMSTALGLPVEPSGSAQAAVQGADIALCATNSRDAVFFAPWIEAGVHLSSIKVSEIEFKAVAKAAHVACHSPAESSIIFETAGVRKPKGTSNPDHDDQPKIDFRNMATLPQLIAGKVTGRTNASDVTCFVNNMGTGFQFAVAGWLAYSRAKERGIGRDLQTDWLTETTAG
jgi:ornithine cyclodeaminase/alanine dehydrogenase-like protein (mu-crystallin family)